MLHKVVKICLWAFGLLALSIVLVVVIILKDLPASSPHQTDDVGFTRFATPVAGTRWSVMGSMSTGRKFECIVTALGGKEQPLGPISFGVLGDRTNVKSEFLLVPGARGTGSVALDDAAAVIMGFPPDMRGRGTVYLSPGPEQAATFWSTLPNARSLYLRTDNPAVVVNLDGFKRALEVRETCVRDMQLWLSVPE